MARSRWRRGVGSSLEVVAAEVGVLGEEVPADQQDRVADRDSGFLLTDPAGEPPELG